MILIKKKLKKPMYAILLLILLFTVSCAPRPPIHVNRFVGNRISEFSCNLSSANRSSSPYGNYSADAVNYLTEVGLGSEFGNNPKVINKWNSPIRIQLHGSYTTADERELDSIISELTRLTGLSITRRAGNSANINIHFIPEENFHLVSPGYSQNSDQMGIFQTFFEADNTIYKAIIAIQHDLRGRTRPHILREELTQSLGLMKDSHRCTNSIFQQKTSSEPTQYAEIDREVIRILYDPRIRPGMSRQDILQTLSSTSPNTTTIAFNQ